MSEIKTSTIWIALEEGDLGRVQEIVNSNPEEVNLHNKSGLSPLRISVSKGNKEITEHLVLHGANVNDISKDGFTSLHLAAQFGLLEIVKLLISHGANVNVKNQGTTPLHLASEFGHNQIVSFLLDNGANIDDLIIGAKGKFGGSAISLAAVKGHKETVSILLSRGAQADQLLLANYLQKFELRHDGAIVFPSTCFNCATEKGTDKRKINCHETIQQGGTSSILNYTFSLPICEKCKEEFKSTNKTIVILNSAGAIIGFFIGIIMTINSSKTGFDRFIPIFGGIMLGTIIGYLVTIPFRLTLNPVKVSDGKLVFSNEVYQSQYEAIELSKILTSQNHEI